MRKIILGCFFFIGIISANSVHEDIWKPASDYYIECSYTDEDKIIERYAYYNSYEDKKFITEFITRTNSSSDFFSYRILETKRFESNDKEHKFYWISAKNWSDTIGAGALKEFKYKRDRNGIDRMVRLNREELTMSNNFELYRKCNIITGDEYQIKIKVLEKERDALIQDLVKKRKSKLKL